MVAEAIDEVLIVVSPLRHYLRKTISKDMEWNPPPPNTQVFLKGPCLYLATRLELWYYCPKDHLSKTRGFLKSDSDTQRMRSSASLFMTARGQALEYLEIRQSSATLCCVTHD